MMYYRVHKTQITYSLNLFYWHRADGHSNISIYDQIVYKTYDIRSVSTSLKKLKNFNTKSTKYKVDLI